MIKNEYKYSDITGKIIGCAIEVHKSLGSGFQEVVYQRAMAIEMEQQGLSFIREFEMSIYYKNFHIGTRRVDFFVESQISLELKAISKLEAVHLAQAINYLEAFQLEIGLLINFGEGILKCHRLHNKLFKLKTNQLP